MAVSISSSELNLQSLKTLKLGHKFLSGSRGNTSVLMPHKTSAESSQGRTESHPEKWAEGGEERREQGH